MYIELVRVSARDFDTFDFTGGCAARDVAYLVWTGVYWIKSSASMQQLKGEHDTLTCK